jgi:hypothetical protein
MKINRSIQLKAAFLLTVFAINTLVAFACSLGVNMGYNKHHHDMVENAPPVYSHHGKYIHQHSTTAHQHHKKSSGDDCCTPNAIQFQQVDKNLVSSINLLVKAPVLIALMSDFYGVGMKNFPLVLPHTVIIPQYFPPPDIRITIQSFQI